MWEMMREMKALVAMVIVQIGYAVQDIMFKLVIEDGVNVRIVVAYRLIFATIFMFLLAFIFERSKRPEFTWRLLILAFLVGLFGWMNNNVSLTFYQCSAAGPNILFAEALARTTATFISIATTLVPLVAFVLAAILRMEHVHLGSKYGKAKVIGTLLSIGGAFLFVLYKGKEIHLWSTHISLGNTTCGTSCFRRRNLVLLLDSLTGHGLGGPCWNTAFMNMMGSLVALLVALSWKPDLKEWRLRWDITLFARIFSGIMISGMAFAVIVWCVDANGPVFVSMFRPVRLVVVVIVASLILQEPIHSGSIVGTVIIVGGLYLVLWAKKKEMKSMSNPVQINRTDDRTVV